MNTLRNSIFVLLICSLAGCNSEPVSDASNNSETDSKRTVLDVMLDVVTPETNIIWDAYELETSEQWQAVDLAAIKTIDALENIKHGGSDLDQNRWSADPLWDEYSDEVISAAKKVRKAVEKRDEELLIDAGEELYAPCEKCHRAFQPDGADQ